MVRELSKKTSNASCAYPDLIFAQDCKRNKLTFVTPGIIKFDCFFSLILDKVYTIQK